MSMYDYLPSISGSSLMNLKDSFQLEGIEKFLSCYFFVTASPGQEWVIVHLLPSLV